jgi:hypothetical protein
VDGRSFLDVDDEIDEIALGRDDHVGRDPGVVVAFVAVDLSDAVDVVPEDDRIEGGSLLPELPEAIPGARLGEHRLGELRFGDGVFALDGDGANAPVASRLDRFGRDSPGSGERKQDRQCRGDGGPGRHGAAVNAEE